MISQEERSSLKIKLEEIYDIADKRLGDAKADLILNDIDYCGYSYKYCDSKLKSLKSIVISGSKFDTPTVFRVLGIKQTPEPKPVGCSKCDDGYIMAIIGNNEYVYACDCNLGRFRKTSESIAYYNNQPKTENQKLFNGELEVEYDKNKVENRLEEFKYVELPNDCPF